MLYFFIKKTQKLSIFIGGIFLSCLASTPAVAELSIEEINSIARQTTVLIAPALTPELRQDLEENRNNPLQKSGIWNPGSGVIIAKTGNKYYVLTVAHNFIQRHLDSKQYWQQLGGIPYYGIRTYDGKVHIVKDVNDHRGCPLKGNPKLTVLVRFGCRDRFIAGTDIVERSIGTDQIRGVDLAIVTFKSTNNYTVAPLGDPKQVNINDRVYISGWPDPEREQDPQTGRCRNRVARRQRRLAWGLVRGKINPAPEHLGYSIFYTDETAAGMSGGPVFDSNGRVVGSHGLGSQSKPLCGGSLEAGGESDSSSDSDNVSSGDSLDFNKLQKRYSSGQNVNYFESLLKEFDFDLTFRRELPRPEVIKAGITYIKNLEVASSSGQVEFDASEDVFDDPNDVVDDIYKLYTFELENMIRDEPSGGPESILLD
ncbi:MAG: trypsin-like peptidase domain-containing protein [Okeania sp. SIO2G4]|uniref:S1 family peptidase n=1 Tax=unclassified Okeania TaxID=2634635 RepID=UPI0013BE3089|nr:MULTISPECIES: serine protease [unclassified Okeania]NEP74769.1 trypsin-like peptidase domain-containing protein [Okeania sp. SIO2G5]NEP95845.1 trypsin-like peptidase domain-containing protein [Okeania sp. SIO2F5]NEQ93572.1 trypsin-like peptidase domain-containing protein [Okeania sp. SIO2G4]